MFRWLIPFAAAHIPHDDVYGVAAPPGLSTGTPWFLLADHDDATDLYRSDDGGHSWDPAGGELLADKLTRITRLDDGRVVASGGERLWVSGDDGASWREAAPPAAVEDMVGGDELYVATSLGLFAGDPDVGFRRLAAGSFEEVFAGADGVVARRAGGTLYWEEDGAWVGHAGPGKAELHAAVRGGGEVFAGLADGSVWRRVDGAWQACAVSPGLDWNPTHPDVVRMHHDGTTLVIAHADVAPVLSTDACATWTLDPAPLGIDWREDDPPSWTDTDKAVRALVVAGETVLVAGYDGPAVRRDGAWTHAPLKGGDYTRGVGWSTRFAEDGLALLPVYGCGVARALDGGAGWECDPDGIHHPGSQFAGVPPDADGLVPAYALVDRVPHRSDDGGQSWVALQGPWRKVRRMELGRDGRVWALSLDDDSGLYPGDLARSDDGGESFGPVVGLGDAGVAADDVIHQVVDAGDLVWTNTYSQVYLSEDGGGTFRSVYTAADEVIMTSPWPAAAPEHLVVLEPGGVWVGTEGAWSPATLPADEPLRRLAQAPDGTLFLTTRRLALWRSDDGGRTWADTGLRAPTQVDSIDVHPSFPTVPVVILSCPSGSFAADVATGRVDRWLGLQRHDDWTDWVTPSGRPSMWMKTAALDHVTRLEAGENAHAWLRGVDLRVSAMVPDHASGVLKVDGAEVASFSHGRLHARGQLVAAGGFADRWHEVVVEVRDGLVLLDAFEGDQEHVSLATPSARMPVPLLGVGCATGAGAAAPGWGVLLAGLWALLRARDAQGRAAGRPQADRAAPRRARSSPTAAQPPARPTTPPDV